jgi:N-acetylglucosaminyl-diphospho-decaprenol L-rhamnosyltransferase
VSAVVVTYNSREYLRRTLRALGDQAGVELEILVVDNGSSDGSAEVVRAEFPRVHLLERDNRGLAGGANAGMAVAQGSYICAMNADVELDPDALARLAAHVAANPRVGAVGPRLRNADGSLQPSGHPLPGPWSIIRHRYRALVTRRNPQWLARRGGDVTGPVGEVTGACILVSRDILEATGGYDDVNFFLNWEDIDWCARIAGHGREVHYVAEAGAVHHWGVSTTANIVRATESGRTGMLRYLRKHHGRMSAVAVPIGLLPADLATLLKAAVLVALQRADGRELLTAYRVLAVSWNGSGRLRGAMGMNHSGGDGAGRRNRDVA